MEHRRHNKYNNHPPYPNNNQRYHHQYPYDNRPSYYPQRHGAHPQRSYYNDDPRNNEPKTRDDRWQRYDRPHDRDRYDRRNNDHERYNSGVGDRHRPPSERSRHEPRDDPRLPQKFDLDLGAEPVSDEEEEEGEARDDDEEGQISDEPMPDVSPPPIPPPPPPPPPSSKPTERIASRSESTEKPRHGHGSGHHPRDYKIIVDPAIHKNQGNQKVYRFAGLMPGTKIPIDVVEPRSRWKVWMRREPVDLEVPKFKVDSNYVGMPLPKEVSFTNLNDNISQPFLEDMCRQFGIIEDCKIFHHPKTKRHLGVGMLMFASTKAAKACVDKLNNTSKMGKVMTVFLDTLGKTRQGLLDDLATTDRPRFEAPVQGIIAERRTSTFEYEDMSAHCKTRYFGREPAKEEKKDKEKEKAKERERSKDKETRRSSTCDEKEDDGADRPPLPKALDSSYDSGPNFTPSAPLPQPPPNALGSLPHTPLSFNSINEATIPFPVNPLTPTMPNFCGFRNRFNPQFQPNFEMKNQPKRFGHIHPPIIQHQQPPPLPPLHQQQQPGVVRFPPSPMSHREFGYQHNLPSSSSLVVPPRPVAATTDETDDPEAKKRRRRREAKERKRKERRAQRVELEEEPSAINDDQPAQSSSPKLEDGDKSVDISGREEDTSAQTTDLDDSRLASAEDNKESTTEPEWDGELNSTAEDDGVLNVETIPLNETNEDEPSFLESSFVEEEPVFTLPMKSSLDSRIEMFLKQQDEDHHPPVLQPPVHPPVAQPVVVDMYSAPVEADIPPMDVEVMMGDLDTGEEVVGCDSMYVEDNNNPADQRNDDDRMSMSSLSSVDENLTISHRSYSQPLNPLMPGFSAVTSPQKQPYMPIGKGPSLEVELASCFDPNDVTFMNILTEIVDQMRLVMQKDLSKRIVEMWGFKKFETWWDEEEQKEKKSMNGEQEPQKEVQTAVIKQDTTASLQSLFERQSAWSGDSLGMGGFLGMKRSVPHMPSFRRFRRFRPPSPPKDDDDEDESADEEDERVEKTKPEKEAKPTKRKPVWTSDSSSGESSSSSSSEAEEEVEEVAKHSSLSSSSSSESDDEEVAESSSSSSSSESEEEIDVESEPTELSKELSTSVEEPIPIVSQPEDIEEEKEKAEEKEELEEKELVQKEVDTTTDSLPEAEEVPKKTTQKRGRKKKEIRPPTPEVAVPQEEEEEPVQTLFSEHNYSSREREPEVHETKPVVSSPYVVEEKTMEDEVPWHLRDHIYFMPLSRLTPPTTVKPDVGSVAQRIMKEMAASASANKAGPKETFGKRPYQRKPKLGDITSAFRSKGNRELAAILEDVHTEIVVKPSFRKRSRQDETDIMYEMFVNGIDEEDISYLNTCYEDMLQEETTQDSEEYLYWLNDVHWVGHPFTRIPDPVQQPQKKKRKLETESGPSKIHSTGSARTEGYYPISVKDKAGYLWIVKRMLDAEEKAKREEKTDVQKVSKQQLSREARSNQRRLLTSYSDVIENVEKSDLLKFNHLKFRKKQIKFAKSLIHDWGLFALEPIAAEEMVIEYVGQSIRPPVADLRETQYQRIGIGSSYLFRVDTETIIDATKVGNLARFINHCCNPNCYAKVITVDSLKKIVIYSRRDIDVNEEITYDYKFPLEDEKIPCLCGAVGCRGYLN